jgi:HD-like signal output (HDOD) protein
MSHDRSAEEAHCRRTAALAVEVGRRAGVALEPLAQAALLHHSMEPLRHSSGLGRLAWQVVGGDDARKIADIVQVCNLVDEQLEALEFEYKDIETILEEIQSFASLEGFDPRLVDYFREMRCRDSLNELKLPVEGATACRVFRTLREEREYEVRDLEAIALHDPVLTSSLIAVANSALYGREYEVRDLEAIALHDPVLTSSLIAVANSALYGRSERVSTVARAIASVGVVAARKIMLGAAMRPLFASAGLKRIWCHALSSAPLCAALASHTGLLTSEEGLVLGLVHDIGAVAVQFLGRETLATYRNLQAGGCPVAYIEHLLLGRDHGEIGARLIAEWNFPDEFIEAVRFHHQPERSASRLPSLAYLTEFWSGLDEDIPSFGRIDACLAQVGITLETLMELGRQDSTLHALKSVA